MKKKNGLLTGIGAIALFAFSKLKFLVVVLKLAKLHTLLSLILSVGVYAIAYGWKFAVGLVYLLFIHEMGHMVGARMKGVPTSPAIFIPFMGAAVGMKEKPKNIKDDVFITYLGPLAGFISILPFFALYAVNKDPFWLVMLQVGAMINLFNLVPMMPLDGGHIARMLSNRLLILGMAGIITLTVMSPDPILVLIVIFGLLQWFGMRKEERERSRKEIQAEALRPFIGESKNIKAEFLSIEENDRALWLNEQIYEYSQKANQLQAALREAEKKGDSIWSSRPGNHYAKVEMELFGTRAILAQLNEWYGEDMPEDNRLERKYEELEKELMASRKFFEVTAKDRWLVLIAYLLLIGVLSGSLVYAMNLLETINIRDYID